MGNKGCKLVWKRKSKRERGGREEGENVGMREGEGEGCRTSFPFEGNASAKMYEQRPGCSGWQ